MTEPLNWRDYLTDEERAIIAQADEDKLRWQASNDRRAGIVNRAIQRARYAAAKREAECIGAGPADESVPRRGPTA